MSGTEITRELLTKYYDGLATKEGWKNLMTDDFLLTGTVVKETRGVDLYKGNGFFRLVRAHRVKELVVEGESASALINYDLASPSGRTMSCDVAELWKTRGGKLASVAVYFDTVAFNSFLAP